MGHIYFIMGVSGAGKGTLIKNIKQLQIPNLHIPLSYKTRPIRETEVHGVDAYFITPEEFYAQVLNDEFLEYAKVHETDYYGTKIEDVIDNGVKKWKIVLKELDINGLLELRSLRPELDEWYTTIFLNIPNDVLVQRIQQRGAFMSDDELSRRLSSAIIEEQKAKSLCDYMIDATLSPEEVLEQTLKIMKLS